MDIQVAEHTDSALRCAVCHDDLGHFKAVCPGCATRLHFSCRATLRRCPTIGCHSTWEMARPVGARLRQATLGLAVVACLDGLIDWIRPSFAGVRERFDSACSPRSRRQLRFVVPVVLVALCAVVTATQTLPAHRSSGEQQVWSDLLKLETAVRLYRMNTGEHPNQLADLRTPPSSLSTWRGPYIAQDPLDPWGNAYVFRHHAGSVYEILSYGADGLPGGAGSNTDILLRRGFDTDYRPDDAIDLNLGFVPSTDVLKTDSPDNFIDWASELEDRQCDRDPWVDHQERRDLNCRGVPLRFLYANLVRPCSVNHGE